MALINIPTKYPGDKLTSTEFNTIVSVVNSLEVPTGSNTQYWRGDKTWQILNKAAVGLGNVDNTADINKPLSSASIQALDLKQDLIPTSSNNNYYRGDKTWQILDKIAVGLGNVDNTSDLNKPISNAVSSSLSLKQDLIPTSSNSTYYRGDKTWQLLNKSAVGLSNVDNTSDSQKVSSGPIKTALDGKVDSSFLLNSSILNQNKLGEEL